MHHGHRTLCSDHIIAAMKAFILNPCPLSAKEVLPVARMMDPGLCKGHTQQGLESLQARTDTCTPRGMRYEVLLVILEILHDLIYQNCRVYIYTYVYIHTYTIHIYIYTYVYMYICIHVYMYTCIYVCMYIHICIYIGSRSISIISSMS